MVRLTRLGTQHSAFRTQHSALSALLITLFLISPAPAQRRMPLTGGGASLGSLVKTANDSGSLISLLGTAVSGDVIYVAPGTYTLPNEITVPSGVSVFGVGAMRTRIQNLVGPTTTHVLVLAGNNQISGIDFYSPDDNWGGLRVNGTSVRIEHCSIGHSPGCIEIYPTALNGDITIADNLFYDSYIDTIFIRTGGLTDATVIDVLRNRLTALNPPAGVGGPFVSITGGSTTSATYPKVNIRDNWVEMAATGAGACTFIREFGSTNEGAGKFSRLVSKNNIFVTSTETGGSTMYLLAGTGGLNIRNNGQIRAEDDRMIVRTISGSVLAVNGTAATIGTDDSGGLIEIVNCHCSWRKSFLLTDAAWTNGTKTLTQVGLFAGYTFQKGDYVTLTDGDGQGVVLGNYQITSKTSDDAIVVSADINGAGGDLGAGGTPDLIVGTLYSQEDRAATFTPNNTVVVLRGSTLNRTVAVTSAASIALNPNLGNTHTWTSVHDAVTLTVATGTYEPGQEIELQIASDGSVDTMTFSGTLLSTGTLATSITAGKIVSVRFRFNGTNWIESWRQLTGV